MRVGDDKDADGETEGEAKGKAEALNGGVVHVTQATLVFYLRG